jgi:acetoacetyl-CoA synthetase
MGLLPQTSPLWTPKNPETTPISKYRHHVNKKLGKNFKSAQEVQAWSVTKAGRQDFWLDLWNYVGMRPRLPSTVKEAYDNNATIDQNPEWFRGVEMNYAENVLEGRDLHQIALIGIREGESLDGEKWTWRQLRENVRKSRSALQQLGVVQGECVAAMMSNSNWTIALFLACASIGVVFTSISPDMGLEGCVSRLKQVQPVIVFADSCQTYKGKKKSLRQKIRETIEAVPDPKPKVFLIPLGGMGETLDYPVLSDFLSYSKQDDALEYTKLPFSSPLIILYSSGTSGQYVVC